MLVVADTKQPLVQEARAGEPDAWAALFKRYQLPIYVYVFELVRDEQTSLSAFASLRLCVFALKWRSYENTT